MVEEAGDFDDIIEYSERVTYNVLKSVRDGLFENNNMRRYNIPNLMAIED